MDWATENVRKQQKIEKELHLESQWQRLMTGKHNEMEKEITVEDAQNHYDRLMAAPGWNRQAIAVLKKILNH